VRRLPTRYALGAMVVLALGAGSGMPSAGAARAASAAVQHPVAEGVLDIAGTLRDGDVVSAEGLSWRPGALKPGQTLLSFEVAYRWRSCDTARGPCAPAADTTVTPFAAQRYVVGHADVGTYLRLFEVATEVVETDPATFSFRVVQSSRRVTSATVVQRYARGTAPTVGFINGTPESTTGSTEENFQVAPAHYNGTDGRPAVQYQLDHSGWRALPTSRVFATGRLGLGPHRVSLRAANDAGTTTTAFEWRVVPLPAPLPCVAPAGGTCWYPPHLDRTGSPMRWDWQIGRVTPLQRTGVHAVDIYDIDGFLTTPAELRSLHTTWQASTLDHPRAVCYLDLAWEDYRPDGSPTVLGGAFPAAALGKVYYGYPQERWVDFRQLHALEPMLDRRIAMCAAKGFDTVELDDIDSYDPPSTTGFNLTTGDAQNYLAWIYNDVHRHGMTALWKNSGLLSWWGRRYTEGAVVEECYTYGGCFSSSMAGSHQYGFTCTNLFGSKPCGYDDFTADTTPQQPTGKWVGESEYVQDHFVCAPGQSCAKRRLYSTYCAVVEGVDNGFAALRLSVNLDGALFQPCPAGR
jgi:Glycoside-hydrolase family GH114